MRVSNVTLAIPTIALLTIQPLTFLGSGRPPVIIAYLVAGCRTAAVQVVAPTALASFVNSAGSARSSVPGGRRWKDVG